MRVLSIILFIFCGLLMVGAANAFMNNPDESGAFLVGIMIPAIACLILGLVFNKLASKVTVKRQTELERYNTIRRP